MQDLVAESRGGIERREPVPALRRTPHFLLQLAARRPVVAVAEALPHDRLLAHDAYPDRFDPHVWFDPDLWSLVGAAIADALVGAGVDLAGEGLPAWQAEAAALHAYSGEVLSSVPEEARVLVTARKLQRVDQSKVIESVNMITPERADIRELTAPETSEE